MLFLASITNKANVDELKRAHYDAHIDYLKALDERILLSAAAQSSPNVRAHELVWIISADTPQEARHIVEGDPFWTVGVRDSCRISVLTKSIPGRRVLI